MLNFVTGGSLAGALLGIKVNTSIAAATHDSYCELHYRDWTLQISEKTPDCFELLYQSQPIFKGQFEVINNSTMLDLKPILWRFRSKSSQLEQWCNIRLNSSISISMTYSFQGGVLVIDYLARSGVPTRLDIRHRVEQVDLAYQPAGEGSYVLSALKEWKHKKDNIPSSYLLESNEREFREAFSSTQWIVLEQNCDVTNRA